MRKHSPLKNHRFESALFYRRTVLMFLIVITLTIMLILRLVYLQVSDHKRYTTLSKQNLLSIQPLEPNRGLVYDRNGVLLAENIPVYNLEIIPGQVKHLDKTLVDLKALMQLTDDELLRFRQSLRKHRRFESIPIRIKLSDDEVAKFYLDQYRYQGVTIKARLIRHYPLGSSLAHILGYVGRLNERELNRVDEVNYSATNYIGKIGVERAYEDQLHGQVGYEQVETDARGRAIRVISSKAPVPGNDIYLSIDSKLTQAVEKAMADHRGAVVAIDPQNGQILAIVSTPNYDPNQFVKGLSKQEYAMLQKDKNQPFYNRALRGLYPPGSTIKPFLALGSLAMHINSAEYQMYDKGWFSLPNNNHKYHDWNPVGRGWIAMEEALITSNDTYFYDLAVRMGIERIDIILENFGIGQPTGIELNEELSGVLPSPDWKSQNIGERWYTGDTVITGIGQGFMLSTPLQLAVATSGIASRGKIFQPTILLKQKTADQQEMLHEPVLTRFIDLKEETWKTIITAMRKVITARNGTGWRFGKDTSYTVAAKTGTAEVSLRGKSHKQMTLPEKLRDNSLFLGFAPADDPKIAVAVMIENNPLAGMVARKVFDAYFNEPMETNDNV